VRSWAERVVEEKNLFNPAFGAMLVAETINDFQKKTNNPLPFAVAFLILPIVLHEATRAALARSSHPKDERVRNLAIVEIEEVWGAVVRFERS
jgi:hypothetical protein